jgi:uncharacterized protein
MPGEKDLKVLLKTMKPEQHVGEFAFCTVDDFASIDIKEIVLLFREEEAYTIILKRESADQLKLNYSFVASWITLTVNSSLEGVGFTAAFSKALADEGIGCNVVAAYYHDHIFVDARDAEKAMQILSSMSD